MMNCFFMVVLMLLHGQRDEERTQHHEDKGLQECHQQFQKTHEYGKWYGHQGSFETSSEAFTCVAEDEDQAYQAEDNDVSGCDIGEQSDHEGEGLDENNENLNGHEDDLTPERNTRRPQDVHPVIFGSVHIGQNESEHRQGHGHCNISGQVGIGDQGIKPSILANQMKKNSVSI